MPLLPKALLCVFCAIFHIVGTYTVAAQSPDQFRYRIVIKLKDNLKADDHANSIEWLKQSGYERVFPYAGKYEARHQEYGLHLWYSKRADEQAYDLLSTSVDRLSRNDFFELVTLENDAIHVNNVDVPDSLFSRQWSFNNEGQTRGLPGADIELINALKIEKGRKSIVVSIHDSGYDSLHEDIVLNLWTNPGEIPDNNIDDDDNGYVDDVHGYNFAGRDNDLHDRDGHGTAIAGIIGSKSNNSGVLGIAGGDRDENGIQLMICRLDDNFDGLSIINPQESIVYAADNGSVISQNSWNTFGTSNTVLTALRYYADVSTSESIARGAIVFSAGNWSSSQERYEKQNENVIMVGSTDHDDIISRFSNYGEWLDLCAPGEDIFSNDLAGNYGLFSGTSFSAPHVTGVAALVLSKYGHPGYHVDSLRARLHESSDSIEHLNSVHFKGRLGSGRLNAFRALIDAETEAPSPVERIWLEEPHAYWASIGWLTPFDNTIAPFHYSIQVIDASNDTSTLSMSVLFPEEGDSLIFRVDSLQSESTYQVRIQAIDYFANEASWSEPLVITTRSEPIIEIEGPDNLYTVAADDAIAWKDTIVLRNRGGSFLEWEIKERPDTAFLQGYQYKFTTLNTNRTWEATVLEQGGSNDFLDSAISLSNTQFLLIDDNLVNYDSLQIEKIKDWIWQGGKAVIGIDGRGIERTNQLIEPLGVEIIPYEEIYYSTISEFPGAGHPLLEGIQSLYFYFQRAYLKLSEVHDLEVILNDENENPYLVHAAFGRGQLLISSNQFFIDFNLGREDNRLLFDNSIKWLASNTILKADLRAGTIPPGEAVSVPVDFSRYLAGHYQDTLVLATNVSAQSAIQLPYQLVNLADEPDNRSPFLVETSFSVEENVSNGNVIGSLDARDPEGDTVYYFIDETQPVRTDSNKLVVSAQEFFDFEVNQRLTAPVILYDGYDTAHQVITVAIINVNEPPIVADTTFVVSENVRINSEIGRWVVIDPEDSVFGFELVNGPAAALKIDSLGFISVLDSSIFDYEANADLTWVFGISDGALTTASSLHIRLSNQNEPPLARDTTFSVIENIRSGEEIGRWVVIDPEDSVFGFELVNGPAAALKIDSLGFISVLDSSIFNYEANADLTWVFGISDGVLTTASSLHIRVSNQNEPPSARDTTFSVIENIRSGEEIGRWVVIDPEDSVFEFELVNGPAAALKIDSLGFISVLDSSVFDYEANADLTWVFGISDGVLTTASSLHIRVSNQNEPPSARDTTFSVIENIRSGEEIGRWVVIDPEDSIFGFELVNGPAAALKIDSLGFISVLDSSVFDYELNNTLTWHFSISDDSTKVESGFTMSILNINEAPTIADTVFSIQENPINGTFIGQLEVNDPEDSLFVFEILTGNRAALRLDSMGRVFVNDSSILDFEANPSLEWNIRVSDWFLSSQSTLILNLVDIDEAIFLSTEGDEIFLFPNPASHVVHINDPLLRGAKLELVDASGKVVKSLTPSSNTVTLDISNVPDGIYLLHFTAVGNAKRARIWKQSK